MLPEGGRADGDEVEKRPKKKRKTSQLTPEDMKDAMEPSEEEKQMWVHQKQLALEQANESRMNQIERQLKLLDKAVAGSSRHTVILKKIHDLEKVVYGEVITEPPDEDDEDEE